MIETGEEFALRAIEREARAYLKAHDKSWSPSTDALWAALDWAEDERARTGVSDVVPGSDA